ncbi:hypothetical protein [Sphingobium aromaticiconvertens]|uniref:hypothetical protein n=1 Tax=Sphingobium aromaticiconvertens TaxID=365341 RepID=UPI003015C807
MTRRFTIRWLIALAGLSIFSVLFPYLLPPLVRATGCAHVGGACGAVALVLAIYLRLPVIIGVGIYLVILTSKQSRIVGAQPWASLFILLTYIAAFPFLFAFGNFGAANFALGIVYINGPLAVLTMLLATLIGLSCLPEESKTRHSGARLATLTTGGIALLLTSNLWLTSLTLIPVVGSILRLITGPIHMMAGSILRLGGAYGLLIVMALFIASLAWWVITARRTSYLNVSISPS